MKHPTKPNMKTPLGIRVIRWAFCAAVVAAIVAGLYVSGSPATRRRYALDERRVNSLSQISYAIDTYAQQHNALPEQLENVAQEQPYLSIELRDPATSVIYEYRTTGTSTTSTYELCATFDLPRSNEESMNRAAPATLPDGSVLTAWDHGAGRTCFPLRVRNAQLLPLPVPAPLPTPKASL